MHINHDNVVAINQRGGKAFYYDYYYYYYLLLEVCWCLVEFLVVEAVVDLAVLVVVCLFVVVAVALAELAGVVDRHPQQEQKEEKGSFHHQPWLQ